MGEMRLSLVRISVLPGSLGRPSFDAGPRTSAQPESGNTPQGWFSALLQLSGLWKPVRRLPAPSTGPKVRTEPEGLPEGLMDEKLACTVKILTPPMKGANGFGIGLGEKLCSSVWLASPATSCRLARDGCTPEFAHEKTSEDVDAGWPHHQELRNR